MQRSQESSPVEKVGLVALCETVSSSATKSESVWKWEEVVCHGVAEAIWSVVRLKIATDGVPREDGMSVR